MATRRRDRPDPKDTARRYIAMLRHLPMRGAITVGDLLTRLRRDGFEVSDRTVERDLQKLSTHWPLVTDEERPAGWCWSSGSSKAEALAALDPAIAIALLRLDQYGQGTLPATMLREFEPWFEVARVSIKKYADYRRSDARNRAKIRRVPDRLMLTPPATASDIVDTILDATREGCQLEVVYQGRERSSTRVLHPACIVEKGPTSYLLATDPGSAELKQFALHRFRRVRMLDEPAVVPTEAEVDACIEEKQTFQYLREPSPIKLVLRCSYRMTTRFNEAKLAPDQAVSLADADGNFELRATVANTEALVWFLREFGPDVEVLGPKHLRAEFAADARALATAYGRRRRGS